MSRQFWELIGKRDRVDEAKDLFAEQKLKS